MAVQDPTKLDSNSPVRVLLRAILIALRGLYTFVKGNEYLTLGAALQITTSPAGTPAANTLYADNICEGWINFNGTGTIAIRDSFNVSGIVDDNTGLYTIALDRDFADENFAATFGTGNPVAETNVRPIGEVSGSRAVGSIQVRTQVNLGTNDDVEMVMVHFFGAQA
jgi:hypothetical protein